jgi:hypothetical protein
MRVVGLNVVLIGVAVVGTAYPWPAFAAGLALTAAMLFAFGKQKAARCAS